MTLGIAALLPFLEPGAGEDDDTAEDHQLLVKRARDIAARASAMDGSTDAIEHPALSAILGHDDPDLAALRRKVVAGLREGRFDAELTTTMADQLRPGVEARLAITNPARLAMAVSRARRPG